jgi:hypothetical protein
MLAKQTSFQQAVIAVDPGTIATRGQQLSVTPLTIHDWAGFVRCPVSAGWGVAVASKGWACMGKCAECSDRLLILGHHEFGGESEPADQLGPFRRGEVEIVELDDRTA